MFGFLKTAHKPERPPLHLHNTLSGELELFTPLHRSEVKMYNCGPTVYAQQHIGNMFSQVFSNTLRRTLDAWGYKVKQVVNITDVGHLLGDNQGDADMGEDRMEASAKLQSRPTQTIAKEITELYFADLDALGVNRSKILFPRATEYINEQIALAQTLVQKGYGYQIGDGVYFDTSRFAGYGKLGAINLAGMQEGTRIEENREKKNPYDFALWKLSPAGEKREQEWESPWGVGFPGWHLECTAMIFTLLGKQIDIHTGGIEHIPVHHNNEIAQAEALTGKQYARYWLHNNHITVEGKKISKSLGNTVYLSQIADRGYSPRSFRYWALGGHYRTPMNFTWDALEGAATALGRLQRFFLELGPSSLFKAGTPDKKFLQEFYAALANDLNTAQALARVWELVKDPNVSPSTKRASLLAADAILGLGLGESGPQARLPVVAEVDLPADVQKILIERETARAAKNFARSDELRTQLEGLGYEVKDTPQGQEITPKN